MPTPQELFAEIESGLLAADLAPLVASRDFNAVAVALNAPTRPGPVPIVEVSGYCVRQGVTGAIKAALDDAATPQPIRVVCHITLTLIEQDYRLTTLDVTDPAFGQVTGGLIAGQLMTAEQREALAAMAANRQSRAQELWGVAVTGTDCLEACGGD